MINDDLSGWIRGIVRAQTLTKEFKQMARAYGTPEFDNDSTVFAWRTRQDPNDKLIHHLNGITVLRTYAGKRGGIQYWVLKDFEGVPHVIAKSRNSGLDALRKAQLQRNTKRVTRVTEEILAVRVWRLVGDILMPAAWGRVDYDCWSGPVCVADQIPTDENSNGIYCVKPATDWIRDAMNYECHVYGIVALSGKVLEYEKGYRAQRATVRRLIVSAPVGDLVIKALEDRYQCEVRREK